MRKSIKMAAIIVFSPILLVDSYVVTSDIAKSWLQKLHHSTTPVNHMLQSNIPLGGDTIKA